MIAEDRWAVGVVVPARDEADRIGPCLTAISASLRVGGHPGAPIVVVADRCRDATAALARATLGSAGRVVVTDVGNVGAARRLGTAHLLRLVAADGAAPGGAGSPAPARTWLLNTDADTTVAADWVAAHLRLARAGAAGVAGTVDVDDFGEHPPGTAGRFHRSYRLHRDGSHPHVHGANLGVRADAYLDVGGWPPITSAEDHALWRRLRAARWSTISSIDPGVTTSGRRTGRAPDGFADHLLALGASGRPGSAADVVPLTPVATDRRVDPAPTTGVVTVAAAVAAP